MVDQAIGVEILTSPPAPNPRSATPPSPRLRTAASPRHEEAGGTAQAVPPASSCREVLWDVLGSYAEQRVDGRPPLAPGFGHEVGVVIEGDGRAGVAEPPSEGDHRFAGFEDDGGVGVPEDVEAVLARCLPALPLLPKGNDTCLREGRLPVLVVEDVGADRVAVRRGQDERERLLLPLGLRTTPRQLDLNSRVL